MKIASIEPIAVNPGLPNWIFVKVVTDPDGPHGGGAGKGEGKTRALVDR